MSPPFPPSSPPPPSLSLAGLLVPLGCFGFVRVALDRLKNAEFGADFRTRTGRALTRAPFSLRPAHASPLVRTEAGRPAAFDSPGVTCFPRNGGSRQRCLGAVLGVGAFLTSGEHQTVDDGAAPNRDFFSRCRRSRRSRSWRSGSRRLTPSGKA